ncbi:MAG: isochorismatase family cysteine hydrolase [Eubacteriales bacterium]|nr:isochorismatase family cysteine hydrolase [Eubacteriales bacterium]
MGQHILVVVDMQNDFIDGALGTAEAVAIVGNVVEKIKDHKGPLFYTLDTHGENYMETQEGHNLPVPHCIKGTHGWELNDRVSAAIEERRAAGAQVKGFEKPTFGSTALAGELEAFEDDISEIEFIGLCTDICVISNAMMAKAHLPEVSVSVDAACCAGVTPASHDNALSAMTMCQIKIK